MAQNLLNTLINNTYSLSQLKNRIRVLKSYLATQFFGGEAEQFSPPEQNFLSILPPSFLSNFSKDNYNQIFSELEEAISKISPLTVYLPFEARDEAVQNLGQKARELFGKSIILDIKYDPRLITGCALVWKGVYKDYSLKSKIEEEKQKLLEKFKTYLR